MQIIKLVTGITKTDTELKKLNILPKDIYKNGIVIVATTSVFVLWFFILAADIWNYFQSLAFKRVGNLIIYTMPPLIIGLVEMQFFIYTLCLKNRFRIINKKLKVIGNVLKNTSS